MSEHVNHRFIEVRAARPIHWLLVLLLLAPPVPGLFHHANVGSSVPIWGLPLHWFGSGRNVSSAEAAADLHSALALVLGLVIVMQISGALKHVRFPATDKPAEDLYTFSGAALLLIRAVSIATGVKLPAKSLGGFATSGNWVGVPGTETLGTQAKASGLDVSAAFQDFRSKIDFDPRRPKKTAILITIVSSNRVSGLPAVDDEVREPEWLGVDIAEAAHWGLILPVDLGARLYQAIGILTINGTSPNVPLGLLIDFEDLQRTAVTSDEATCDCRDLALVLMNAPDGSQGDFPGQVAFEITAKNGLK